MSRLLQRPQATATQALADQDCWASHDRPEGCKAALVRKKIQLNI